jgi:hypothetical protein
MYDHFIQDMVRKLTPVLKNRKKAELILRQYWTQKMALVWSIQDVHRAANERKRALTRSEAVQILQTLHQQHNPQYGLKWTDLWDHFDLYEPGRKMSKAEISRFVTKDIITVQK